MLVVTRKTILLAAMATTLAAAAQMGAQARARNTPTPPSPPTLLVDIDHRPSTSLNGDWHFLVDPYRHGGAKYAADAQIDPTTHTGPDNELVEYNFAASPTLHVPGDWNTQRPDLFYYEGVIWYERTFNYTPRPGMRTFLHFGAVNYRAVANMNGTKVCEHEGGFTPFDCEVTGNIKAGQNSIVVSADDTRLPDGVPTLDTDWWNYGGIHRDVSLVDVPAAFIDDYGLQLNPARPTELTGYVHVDGAASGTTVTVAIPELNATTKVTLGADSRAAITLPVTNLKRWSPETPKLYKVNLASGPDTLSDDIGFRTIRVDGTHIMLNEKPIFLHGACVHAEAPIRTGRANTQADVDTLLGYAKDLNANFLRLAHYPHDERMTRTADRLGILIWSEVPVYWGIKWSDPVVLAKAEAQIAENIRRDHNKAAIILWSVANETQISEPRNKFLETLVTYVHSLDANRPVTAALLVRTSKTPTGTAKVVNDPLGQYLDVIGANEYIGWYEQPPAGMDTTTWDIRYQKPLIMSEFGGGAKAGLHGPASQRWTEEYQADIYKHQFAMLNRIPQLRGMTPWVLMDFRSPVRLLPGIQDNFNRKGLVSDQGQKKAAFTFVQQAYKTNSVGKAE